MTAPAPPTDDEIHAYVDDALDPARRAQIADIVRADPILAARLAAYQADRDGLRRALMTALTTPAPGGWRTIIEDTTSRRPALSRRRAIAAGMGVAASAGIVAVLRYSPADSILAEALAAREAVPDGGDSRPTPPGAAPNAMLAAALGLKLRAPDMTPFGFRLAGLRVIGAGRPAHAAQLAYRDGRNRRLTIYLRASDGTVRFDLLRHGKDRVCIWQDDVVSAVIIAPMSAGEMMRVASNAYSALNL